MFDWRGRLKSLAGVEPVRSGDAYHVFTRKYDVTVDAGQLDDVLGPLGSEQAHELEEAWNLFETRMTAWKTDASLHALEMSNALCRAMSPQARADTIVALLVDQSGSMRGPKMLLAAAAVDAAQAALSGIGIAVEMLGFTTVDWRGGRARRLWSRLGRPRSPGRLCDLLHIVYRDASERGSGTGGYAYRGMLRPDLPKENVDGEAVEWAASRLRSRPQRGRVLLVVSDGAPVDDSTLKENGASYLSDHLHAVIAREAAGISICGLGLQHHASKYYATYADVLVLDQLAPALFDLLQRGILAGAPAG